MPGNLRRKTSKTAGRTERDYLRARRQLRNGSQICSVCRSAIDLTLKPICQYVKTSGYSVENAHEIPLTCGPNCKGHARKANPWSFSADHKIPVDMLQPDSPLLTSVRNLRPTHLRCNQSKGNRTEAKPRNKTSRDWFA